MGAMSKLVELFTFARSTFARLHRNFSALFALAFLLSLLAAAHSGAWQIRYLCNIFAYTETDTTPPLIAHPPSSIRACSSASLCAVGFSLYAKCFHCFLSLIIYYLFLFLLPFHCPLIYFFAHLNVVGEGKKDFCIWQTTMTTAAPTVIHSTAMTYGTHFIYFIQILLDASHKYSTTALARCSVECHAESAYF